MKKSNLLLAIILFISITASAQQARIIKWNELEGMLHPDNDTTYVINFWATWCKPCITELPHFDRLAEVFPNRKLKVILVSLDFKRQFETNLIPYIQKNKIQSEVFLIDEPDYNLWIDKVADSWNGAIPATIIINKSTGLRNFYEREFTASELNSILKPLIP